MSFVKRVYFSPVGYVISAAMHLLGMFSGPFMIYGYRNRVTRKFLRGVRISSSAVITNKVNLNVGDDVWIGSNVCILPGVTIGSNVVIGAGSVVNKDIPDGVVAVGNPCRPIRKITAEDKNKYLVPPKCCQEQ